MRDGGGNTFYEKNAFRIDCLIYGLVRARFAVAIFI